MSMTRDEEWLLKEKYNGEKTEGFFTDCERLRLDEPLAYIIGSTPFLNTTIYLDSKPLIPRPETEFWVEKAIERIRCGAPKAPRILDLCAGSGAIGVAVLKALPHAHVTFGEIDEFHLLTIKKNLSSNLIIYDTIQNNDSHAIPPSTAIQSDLFENIKDSFDFILSNPPYIDTALNRTEHSVKTFEPHKALYGGRLGLEVIERIITEAPTHLCQNGELWIEHEPEQKDHIIAFAKKHGLHATVHNDQYNLPRYSILTVAQ